MASSSSNTPSLLLHEEPQKRHAESTPRWVPIAMLAVSSAALAVPLLLLRRQRATAKSLNEASPPRRRTRAHLPQTMTRLNATTEDPNNSTLANQHPYEDDFNAPLYVAKAFGIATLFVGVGATVSIWGIRTYMGVRDAKEFGDRMRSVVLEKLPALSARIYRPATPTDDGDNVIAKPTSHNADISSETGLNEKWNWLDAEHRLKDAFEKEGLSGWAVAAVRELEKEGNAERMRRGLDHRVVDIQDPAL